MSNSLFAFIHVTLPQWIAWHLPRRVVLFASIRCAAHASSGEWSNQIIPELTAMDAVNRWENRVSV